MLPLGWWVWARGGLPYVVRDHRPLAHPSAPLACLFQDLLDPARWRMLTQQFRYDNYRLHQLGNNSVFTLTLQAGLSAIKTPYPPGRGAAELGPSWPGVRAGSLVLPREGRGDESRASAAPGVCGPHSGRPGGVRARPVCAHLRQL